MADQPGYSYPVLRRTFNQPHMFSTLRPQHQHDPTTVQMPLSSMYRLGSVTWTRGHIDPDKLPLGMSHDQGEMDLSL